MKGWYHHHHSFCAIARKQKPCIVRKFVRSVHSKPWEEPMSTVDFNFMREILAAPSPVGLEAAMTKGVIKPKMQSFMPDSWKLHEFIGNAGLVCDTMPNNTDKLTCMIVGHADKIRMQVRYEFVCDSFLLLTTHLEA